MCYYFGITYFPKAYLFYYLHIFKGKMGFPNTEVYLCTISLLLYFKLLFIIWESRKKSTERNRTSSQVLVHSQIPTRARASPIQCQVWQEPKELQASALPPRVCLGRELKSGDRGENQTPGIAIWNTAVLTMALSLGKTIYCLIAQYMASQPQK